MAVFYRLSQVTSPKQKGYGKWYPRAVMTSTVDTDALATIMQRNCTVKKSDILAVITELIETMQDQLQDSKRVKLNGFGTFKIGICSEGANSAADFSVSKNVKNLHVLFSARRPSSPVAAYRRHRRTMWTLRSLRTTRLAATPAATLVVAQVATPEVTAATVAKTSTRISS